MTGSEVQTLTTVSWIIQIILAVAVTVITRKSLKAKPQLIVMLVIGFIMAVIPCGPIMIFLLIGWSVPTLLVHLSYQRQLRAGESALGRAGSFPITGGRAVPGSQPLQGDKGFGTAATEPNSDRSAGRDNPFL